MNSPLSSSTVSPVVQPLPGRRLARRLVRLKRATLWKSVGQCLAGGMVFAVANTSWAAAYTYSPTTSGNTDTWSSGTNWTPGAPVSDPSTSLSFGTTGATIAGTFTSDDDYNLGTVAGAFGPNLGFQLNSLNLNGTGGTAGIVNITNSGGLPLEFESNAGTTPVINLNALKGTALTYNVYTPLVLDNNITITGNGTAAFNFIGALTGNSTPVFGTGNILKTGTSTFSILSGVTTTTTGAVGTTAGTTTTSLNTTNYSGSVDVEGGTFTVTNGGTSNGGTVNGTSYLGQFFTSGTTTIGASGTLNLQGGGGAPNYATSALLGSGTLTTGNGRFLAVNYNGATADTFTGTFSSVAALQKSGLGALNLTGATLQGNGSQWIMAGGTLNVTSLQSVNILTLESGTINVTPTAASGMLLPGLGGRSVLSPSVLSVVPNEVAGSAGVAMTETIASSGSGSPLAPSGGTLSPDLGNASSLAVVIGNSTYTTNSPLSYGNFSGDFNNGRGFIIAPDPSATAGQGINALGKGVPGTTGSINVVVVEGSNNTSTDDLTLVTNPTVNGGMVDAGIVGQNNDANKSGTFLTYVTATAGTHVATDQGFTPVTFDDTNFGIATGNTTKELVTASTSLTATSTAVFALQVGATNASTSPTLTIPTGDTLTVGVNNGTAGTPIRAGIILNGGTISGGTVAFGTSSTVVYTSAANATISSALTGTAAFVAQGPGVLSLTGSTTGLTGFIFVLGGTLETPNGTLPVGALNFENGVYQSYSTTGAATTFTRALNAANGSVAFNNVALGAGGGFSARGGAFNVNIGGSGTPSLLVWGTTNRFLDVNGSLLFGSPTADNTTTLQNPLSLGSTNGNYTRIINVFKSATSNNDLAVISGVITTGTNGSATANGTDGAFNILAKTGLGTLSLTANNLYTGGTVVNQGTLLINDTPVSGVGSGTGTGAVSITGGTLGGTGRIAGVVTIATGARITGATAGTVGTLTLAGSATINGTYLADLSGTTSDNLKLGGALTLSGATLTFSGTATASTYDLANYASETGTFAVSNLPAGYSLSYGATELDLVAPVPEPSTWVGGLMLVGLIGYSQRRRFGAVLQS